MILDSLVISVPIRIEELKKLGGPSEFDINQARDNMTTITGAIFSGGHDEIVAREFNIITKAITILAFADGGIKFAGLHFDATN